jgi:hypothetical protein
MGEYPRGKQGQGQDLFACGESALWHHAVNQPRGGGGSRHREMGLAFHARWFVRELDLGRRTLVCPGPQLSGSHPSDTR